jgi:hypothetical protein
MQVLGAPFSEAEELESKFYPTASIYLVKFTLEQAAKAIDGGWVVNATPRPLYPMESAGTHCIGGWVGPRPVWKGAVNLGSAVG